MVVAVAAAVAVTGRWPVHIFSERKR